MTVATKAAANVSANEVTTPLSLTPSTNSPGLEAKIVATRGTRMNRRRSRPTNVKTQSIRLSTRVRVMFEPRQSPDVQRTLIDSGSPSRSSVRAGVIMGW